MGAPNGDNIGDPYARLPAAPSAMQANDGNAALGILAESFEAWFARQPRAG